MICPFIRSHSNVSIVALKMTARYMEFNFMLLFPEFVRCTKSGWNSGAPFKIGSVNDCRRRHLSPKPSVGRLLAVWRLARCDPTKPSPTLSAVWFGSMSRRRWSKRSLTGKTSTRQKRHWLVIRRWRLLSNASRSQLNDVVPVEWVSDNLFKSQFMNFWNLYFDIL